MARRGKPERNPSSNIHWSRWVRIRGGKTVEEVAKEDGIQEATVNISLLEVDKWRALHTAELANQQLMGIVMESTKDTSLAIKRALNASFEVTKTVGGKKVKVQEPDITTQLKGVAEVREFAKVYQPKSGGGTHVQVGIGINGQRQATGDYVGYEERLREIKRKRQEQPLLEGRIVQQATLEAATGEFAETEEETAR